MAKYYVTHKCGHEVEVELLGSNKSREYRIHKMEQEECPECRAAHATERDTHRGYASLKGSPKQIAWASDIRETLMGRMAVEWKKQAALLDQAEASGDYTAEKIQAARARDNADLMACYNGLAAETSARELIDIRDMNGLDVIDHYLV